MTAARAMAFDRIAEIRELWTETDYPSFMDALDAAMNDPTDPGILWYDDDDVPFVCPYCAGDGCKSCGYTGHLLDPDTGVPVTGHADAARYHADAAAAFGPPETVEVEGIVVMGLPAGEGTALAQALLDGTLQPVDDDEVGR